MDLSVSPRRQKGESVTLLSYANNHTGTKTVSNGYVHRFASNSIVSNGSNFYAVAPPCVVKKSEKFLRTFRKRSKSASRLIESESTDNLTLKCGGDDSNSNFSGSVLTLHEETFFDPGSRQSVITYVANGERARNPDRCVKPDKVTLVGFATKSTCDLFNMTHEGSNELDSKFHSTKQSGFSTLKTSREVKMERERLRQERQQKLSQETRDWVDRVHQDGKEANTNRKSFQVTSTQLEEELARFFEETRQKFHSRVTSTCQPDEVFNQFVRDNQEKISQLNQQLQQQQSTPLIVSLTGSCSSTSQQQHLKHNGTLTGRENEAAESRESWEGSSSVSPAPTLATPLNNSSSGQRNTPFSYRALLNDGTLPDSFNPGRQPSTAEVVASLLRERCYTTRRPVKQRLTLSRSNNLNIINNNNNNIIVTTSCPATTESTTPRVSQTIKVIQESVIRTVASDIQKANSDEQSDNPPSENFKEVKSRGEVVRKVDTLKRSNSGSSGLSSSSSGFSSLAGDNILFHSSPVQSKFRQLLEKRNSCDNHLGFASHFVDFEKLNTSYLKSLSGETSSLYPISSFTQQSLSEGGETPSSSPSLISQSSSSDFTKCPKVSNSNGRMMTESKSPMSLTPGKDGTPYSHTEELVTSTYGDSETETDEEEEDEDDDLDSVSVVDDRHSNLSNGISQQAIHSSGDADSGRGNSPPCSSPASSSSSTIVSGSEVAVNTASSARRKSGGRKSNATVVVKPARPISAVPSELSDISYTTSDDAGIEDEQEDLPSTTILKDAEHPPADSSRSIDEAHKIACELLSTEEQYVSVLSLIDQKFYFRVDQENRVSKMFPPETLVQMFANIKSIYQFHAEFVLPPLRERMAKWPEDPQYQKIGDIMVRLSHFFKIYTEYVKSFENARNTINSHYQKNAKFAAIMDEIHALPECGNLTLQQHMLTPIQRIPRYVLLLKKYLSKLPEDSPDRADSEQTLQLVSAAASHAEDAIRKTEKFKKVLEVQESLGGTIDLISPTRELIKEGKIVKISARSGDHQDRYLFLFSDLLLLCSSRLGNRVINRPIFRLRARFEVDNIQVHEGNNLVTANTFFIKDDHKSVELYTQTRAEKEEWVSALFHTIKELFNKKSSLKIGENLASEVLRSPEADIGRIRPRFLKVDSIQRCMDCGQSFTLMKKKYHCSACGIVACNKCSSKKFSVTSSESKPRRVCRPCYAVLRLQSSKESMKSDADVQAAQDDNDLESDTARALTDPSTRPRGLLEVSASAPSIISGYLFLLACQLRPSGLLSGDLYTSNQTTSKPIKRWFALHRDFVIYTFQSESDSHALTATPVPGYTLLTGEELTGDVVVSEKDRDKTIKMLYSPIQSCSQASLQSTAPECRKAYYFISDSVDETRRWAVALKSASRAEAP